MLIVPRGVSHRIDDEQPSILLLLCIEEAFFRQDPDLNRLWFTLTRVPNHCLRLSRPTRQQLESMWRRAMVEKQHARVGGLVAIRSIAAQTLVLLARLPGDSAGTTAIERVTAIKREIEETFYEPWDLDRAALRAGLSRRRFTELFRTAAGETFWDFLNERRLTHAAHLLRSGENSVLGVMFAAGFNDLSHFYRQFRERFGKPPKQWREKNS
jgi:AraC family L-rhamnose operon regulatory protein RhaS